jgi:hypothetical protein
VSDELKLDQATEQKLSTIVKDLGSKKSKMSEDLAVIVEELRNANTKKRGSLLLKYEENIRNYSRLNQNEFTQLRSLLGDARLSRYLVLKSDFAQKMRDLVSAKEIEGDTREASEKAKSNLRKKEN